MNLFEITDEFANVKLTPQEEIEFLLKREKAIEREYHYINKITMKLKNEVAGNIRHPIFNQVDPSDPVQKIEIDKVIAQGYVPIIIPNPSKDNEVVVNVFVPDLPSNRLLIPKLTQILIRYTKVYKLYKNIPGQIKRAKGRLSAWKRKQPNYVGRATGKELLAEIKKKVQDFITSKNWPLEINNSYYWAKNKMIVIEIPVQQSIDGKSAYEAAKTIVKPDLTKFLDEIGYTQFRVVDRYNPEFKIMNIKIQLDDLEAKNKASENETT